MLTRETLSLPNQATTRRVSPDRAEPYHTPTDHAVAHRTPLMGGCKVRELHPDKAPLPLLSLLCLTLPNYAPTNHAMPCGTPSNAAKSHRTITSRTL